MQIHETVSAHFIDLKDTVTMLKHESFIANSLDHFLTNLD